MLQQLEKMQLQYDTIDDADNGSLGMELEPGGSRPTTSKLEAIPAIPRPRPRPPPKARRTVSGRLICAYNVQGAGTPAINGRYVESGTSRWDGTPFFIHQNGSSIRSGGESSGKWYIHEAQQESNYQGAGNIIYAAESRATIPPKSGWTVYGGQAPPPRLQPIYADAEELRVITTLREINAKSCGPKGKPRE